MHCKSWRNCRRSCPKNLWSTSSWQRLAWFYCSTASDMALALLVFCFCHVLHLWNNLGSCHLFCIFAYRRKWGMVFCSPLALCLLDTVYKLIQEFAVILESLAAFKRDSKLNSLLNCPPLQFDATIDIRHFKT